MNDRIIWYSIALVILIRFITLNDYPLTDNTEARYGEVARVMAETGQWITPQLVPGEPFWAKPPLSFWQGAISVTLLGVSEFALRLPPFLNFIGMLLLVLLFASKFATERIGSLAVLVAASTVMGVVVSGGVMTDPAMLLGTTLCFYSFWRLISSHGKKWAYVLTFGLVIALLAKGPIAIILSLIPIVLWITISRQWLRIWTLFPFGRCVTLFIVLGVPWFLVAEYVSPGYLNYYFIGEHFNRYLVSGWEGDLYGSAHQEPYGKIWVFAVIAFFPWTFIAAIIAIRSIFRRELYKQSQTGPVTKGMDSSLLLYLVLWSVWPLVFFSFASNILPTYALTGLPAFAILTGNYLNNQLQSPVLSFVGLTLPLVFLVALPLGFRTAIETESQQSAIEFVQQKWPEAEITYVGSIPHSARFYSRGAVHLEPDIFNIKTKLQSPTMQIVFVKQGVQFKDGTPLIEVTELGSKRFQGYVSDPAYHKQFAAHRTAQTTK